MTKASVISLILLWYSCLFQKVSFADGASSQGGDKDEQEKKQETLSSALFAPSKLIQISPPTSFAKPTHVFNDRNITVVVEPTHGLHRKEKDAVLAYAEGYSLNAYRIFLETLEETGFDGDVVLAISEKDMVRPKVEDYLKQYAMNEKGINPIESKMNVVTYMHELNCLESDYVTKTRRKFSKRSGGPDVFQMCCLDNVYGYKDKETGKVTKVVEDARTGRVVATLRYEWYWIWSLRYNPHSWIMLIDARDTIFQLNPFDNVPRSKTPTNPRDDSGYLYFFGENHDATRLGISTKNRNWLKNGYGDSVIDALKEKPTICSGSTMGEQIALEVYLRALTGEWDETEIRMTGSDQGFHNYLYYSGKLHNVKKIRSLIVWEQGKGIINNLGALRTKTLQEWGIYDPIADKLYQWDKKTLSPVVHQYDRDKEMYRAKAKIMKELAQWK